ncbi:type IV inositol polyphosphate 5-phosphatase 9-like [Tasmannia lanceolata]|uniref:type IV inositol polyphosphate 5-phosphatase 9-like n=1 Tax=Tasmannia lanceolata TaxID=3420 RepID=UPI0040631999
MQGKHGEIKWPKLVANKLGKSLGSYRWAANCGSTEILTQVPQACNYKKDTLKYKLFVRTWNVGGIAPTDDLKIEDWPDPCENPCDFYVLGFQETVPLSARNVLGPESTRISMKWNSLIRAALNRTILNSKKNQELKVGERERQKVYPVKDSDSRDSIPFKCIISKQMVGIFISVWARADLFPYIRNQNVSCVGSGIMGCLGNKGSVSIRFCLHGTSFCFVCCHLASGGKEGDEMHRNSDVEEILSRTSFPRGPSLHFPRKILDHDRIIWLGDLNYRISMPEAMTRFLVDKKDWNTLLENDQLKTEISEGRVFEGWQEGIIEFAPTYKYYPKLDKYYGCDQGRKGEKKRAPAWCDRIIWNGKGLKQNQYSRGESRLSDHRPVHAIFTAEVDALRNSKAYESFFLSNRYDHLKKYKSL